MANRSAVECFNQKKKKYQVRQTFITKITSKSGEIIIDVAFGMCVKCSYLHINEKGRGKAVSRREITLASLCW